GRPDRQYDLPTATEISAILLEKDDIAEGTDGRDIVIQGKGGQLRQLYESSPLCDPLQYILLHPRGEQGWTYKQYISRILFQTGGAGGEGQDEQGGIGDDVPNTLDGVDDEGVFDFNDEDESDEPYLDLDAFDEVNNETPDNTR
ncbi:hypothetical protein BX616_009518, partial [Lobosporangium transversale]